jgi:hypothetical protein
MGQVQRVATLSLVLLVVLAGCSGGGNPTTDATTTVETITVETTTAETTTPGTTTLETTERNGTADSTTTAAADRETVRVTGGNLSVDETEVFWRVQELMGADARPQPVEVRNITEWKGYNPGAVPLLAYLGLENVSLDPDEPGGLTTTTGKVYVYPGTGTPSAVERVLVHEFVHATQYRTSMLPWLSAIDQPRITHDLLQTRLALVEGGAVYVTDAYADRHLDGEDPAGRVADRYRNGSASEKYFYARYHLGHRYVDAHVDSPENLESIYADRPNTTEQLLHDYGPGEEPPADLAVSANGTDDWVQSQNDTMGELFARVVLQSELDAGTARSAAAGWGNDALHDFARGDEDPGFAWTLRMDSAAEADELESAVTTFAERREAVSDGEAAFRVERVGDETVVLLFGNPEFVESATVSGSSGNVTVSIAE